MTNGVDACTVSVGIKTLRKVRLRIIPFIFILFVVAYLDRINIGLLR